MRYTKGPWKVIRDNNKVFITAPDPTSIEPWYVAEVYKEVGSGDEEEVIANAQLLAAAPQMLAALEWITAIICDKELCGHFLPEEIRQFALPAIAKAKGE